MKSQIVEKDLKSVFIYDWKIGFLTYDEFTYLTHEVIIPENANTLRIMGYIDLNHENPKIGNYTHRVNIGIRNY